jgi:predicted membrane-bound dolichyl-phosphate-mannose-protein mannosyltransferase
MLKKIILNDEIKKTIFKEFSFKYKSESSSNQAVLKEIYNAYFCKYIIHTEADDNKNVSYSVSEDVYKYYHFAKENYKVKKFDIFKSGSCLVVDDEEPTYEEIKKEEDDKKGIIAKKAFLNMF